MFILKSYSFTSLSYKDETSENGRDEVSDTALDSEVQSSSSPSEKEQVELSSGYEEKVVMDFAFVIQFIHIL